MYIVNENATGVYVPKQNNASEVDTSYDFDKIYQVSSISES